MFIQYLSGIEIKLQKPFDLNFINDYGKVFRVFERGGGNLCFGVEKADKRYLSALFLVYKSKLVAPVQVSD